MNNIVEAKKLCKNYFNKKALNNFNLTIEKGKVFGLLGPNGSGKTTFIKIITGLLRESSGEVFIDGKKPGIKTKAIVSYLPDKNYLYKWMKIKDAIGFFKDFYKDFDEKKCHNLLKFMKLEEDLKVNSLSKGMLEKLNLTLVLSRKAKLFVLDEPLAAVDPVAREQILDAIIQNYNEESSMIITTHLVRDIERIFDDVAFIKDGNIVLQGNAEDLRVEKQKSIDELFREVFQ
ncbi:ABC transporter ATP-binding protein [Clostridium botulinum]|uniref:Multidrug ABC transporter ATP-binding protein n=1 Tax=Clostridium botulinum C/D str. DC5 TaxID=1443128 RepID=A0A0A0I518_CLOBO|nr:ABC transporter ATP-binding protein [Clostridium botulinum]KEI04541.1 multidrug ABC transporter ATP-binding protein [Clostridium botulinum C/D str. BKT75002]KEI07344.1 multidrug ABC transporter ATP-binding protein [Clostridium botulinum C/D str. BKT2873]KGM95947.1 multidrug ABC transporter ATP-binding protein [Clostridium botulinum C/D str. DC5]KGM97982.1 multidrug ABC transporter ATP-binding protein [Clostridium botulinum D str. CCUG 7971]KOC46153.1 multidrug ABC transporter ATP-binding pr